jgi:hypothetical protein
MVSFFGRTFDEYMQMFALHEAALRGLQVLDCPSGPDSFVAVANARGLQVTGCDPVFGGGADELRARAKANIEATFDALARATNPFTFRDPAKFRQDKFDALDAFVADYRTHGATRYVHAALPALPFTDRSYDLVLSSHFLFCYASVEDGGMLDHAEFDPGFHLKSIRELTRVARREVRMTPTHAMHLPPRHHPYLEAAMHEFRALGFDARLEPSTYDDGFAPLVEVLVATRRA